MSRFEKDLNIPVLEGKGEYRSYFLPYYVHLQETRSHNDLQVRSARNEQLILDMKSSRESRRAVRREVRLAKGKIFKI